MPLAPLSPPGLNACPPVFQLSFPPGSSCLPREPHPHVSFTRKLQHHCLEGQAGGWPWASRPERCVHAPPPIPSTQSTLLPWLPLALTFVSSMSWAILSSFPLLPQMFPALLSQPTGLQMLCVPPPPASNLKPPWLTCHPQAATVICVHDLDLGPGPQTAMLS